MCTLLPRRLVPLLLLGLLTLWAPACNTPILQSIDATGDVAPADVVAPPPDGDVPIDLAQDAAEQVDTSQSDAPQSDAPQSDAPLDSTLPVDDVALDQSDSESDLAGLQTISVKLVSANDAVTSYLLAGGSGWNYFYGDTVYLGRHFDVGQVSYHTALRFLGVAIPKGAQVVDARLTFFPANSVDRSNNLWINVYAEKSADSPPYDPTNYDSGRPDQRLKTTQKIDHWLVRCADACTDLSEYDCPQRQLDCWDKETAFELPKNLAPLIQELVDLDGWAVGNALSLMLINAATDQDGVKYAKSRAITGYDPQRGPQFSPTLTIQFIPSN